jgi:hypothetical protein
MVSAKKETQRSVISDPAMVGGGCPTAAMYEMMPRRTGMFPNQMVTLAMMLFRVVKSNVLFQRLGG